MSSFGSTTSFGTAAAPTFHATSIKRGGDAMGDETSCSLLQNEQTSNKRIKISSPESGLHDTPYQQRPFQAPIQSTGPSGSSNCLLLTTSGGESRTNKKQRIA